MATVTTNIVRTFADLDLNFNIHPIKKDINLHKGELAIINSIKNLILTNYYERLFQPSLGSNVRRLLFENMDSVTASSLEYEIKQCIENYEPRASVHKITAKADFDNNGYNMTMEFFVINRTDPISITFFLERIR